MSTATVQPGRTAARASAVRVGARTHAGYLSGVTAADGGALYAAGCGAGKRNGEATPRPAVADRIDCGNCLRRHAEAAGVAIVLADGTRVRVRYAHRRTEDGVVTATPGGWGYTPGIELSGPFVSVTVQVDGEPLPMRAPLSLNLPRLVDRPHWLLTLPLYARVALVPVAGGSAR